MGRIVIDSTIMKQMSLFEKVTRARLKDMYEDELTGQMVFIVSTGEIGKAIGKGGTNIKKLENMFKKKIKIVEYSEDKLVFIKNMLYPLKVRDIKEEDEGLIHIEAVDLKTRGYIIGRNAQNLRNLEKNVRRHFDIKEIKVLGSI